MAHKRSVKMGSGRRRAIGSGEHERKAATAARPRLVLHVPALLGRETTRDREPWRELQRAAGRWQAEWPTVGDLLRVVAGAVHHARAMLDDLTVDAQRMADRVARA